MKGEGRRFFGILPAAAGKHPVCPVSVTPLPLATKPGQLLVTKKTTSHKVHNTFTPSLHVY
jgi:hypothetical protein